MARKKAAKKSGGRKKAKASKKAAPAIAPAVDPIEASLAAAARETERARKRTCDIGFRQYLQERPLAPNYLYGKHTNRLIDEMQAAADAIERGECVYRIVVMPPRHGKSDVASRGFPPWFLARFPDCEFILGTYAAELSEGFSRVARRRFTELGADHGLRISNDFNQVGAWGIQNHRGAMYAVGLGGAITGRGAHFLNIDDYCKNRAEAESQTLRDQVWDSFRSDLMTRLAPAHAVFITATRWHEDDLVGRILEEMKKDEDFPRFELIHCPAQHEDGSYLFTERFSERWYQAQKVLVGNYAWESLYQGNPRPRTGRLLRADLVEIVNESDVPENLRFCRGWDLASSEAERVKDDPDYTVGTLAADDGDCIWVKDVRRGQWTALKRDREIERAALSDGPGVPVHLETVGGYKDTYIRLANKLHGKASVRKISPKGDKVTRWSVFEPRFEAGKVKIVKAPWNEEWIKELGSVPKAKHDDQADSLYLSVGLSLGARRRASISR